MPTQAKSILSANGDTSVVDFYGGFVSMVGTGTWGSGTATLNASYDGGSTYVPLGTLTANGISGPYNVARCKLKASLTGSTTPALTLSIESLR